MEVDFPAGSGGTALSFPEAEALNFDGSEEAVSGALRLEAPALPEDRRFFDPLIGEIELNSALSDVTALGQIVDENARSMPLQDRPPLGVGIITHNRLGYLKRCVAEIQRLTRSRYVLVIADDGSDDGTVVWARGQGIPVVTGTRIGVAWNKNRALKFLETHTSCDPIILLEDDIWPVRDGWDLVWSDAAVRWDHVNYDVAWGRFDPSFLSLGKGTTDDPFQSQECGGACTATSRSALAEVGFFDTRFRGYGYGHVEWTSRYRHRFAKKWGFPDPAAPGLTHGVLLAWGGTSAAHSGEAERNKAVLSEIYADPEWARYRKPWASDEECRRLTNEIASGWHAYLADPRPSEIKRNSTDSSEARSQGDEDESDPLDIVRRCAEAAHERLANPNGPTLVVHTSGTSPLRTVVSLCSMVLNGYVPPNVWIVVDRPMDDRASELFNRMAPWARVFSYGEVLEHFVSLGGEDLVERALADPCLLRSLFVLTYDLRECCVITDDVLVTDGLDDAVVAFMYADLVFAPGHDRGELDRKAWPLVRSVPSSFASASFDGEPYWLRRFVDPAIVVDLVLSSKPMDHPPEVTRFGLIAMLYGSRFTAQLPAERYGSHRVENGGTVLSLDDVLHQLRAGDPIDSHHKQVVFQLWRLQPEASGYDNLRIAQALLDRYYTVRPPDVLRASLPTKANGS